MDLLDLFWDLHQQRRLAEHDAALDSVSAQVESQADELTRLRRECSQLTLACHALVRLLIAKGVVGNTELESSLLAVSAELQAATGKHLCAGCGRLAKPVAGRCMYCGRVAMDRTPSA